MNIEIEHPVDRFVGIDGRHAGPATGPVAPAFTASVPSSRRSQSVWLPCRPKRSNPGFFGKPANIKTGSAKALVNASRVVQGGQPEQISAAENFQSRTRKQAVQAGRRAPQFVPRRRLPARVRQCLGTDIGSQRRYWPGPSAATSAAAVAGSRRQSRAEAPVVRRIFQKTAARSCRSEPTPPPRDRAQDRQRPRRQPASRPFSPSPGPVPPYRRHQPCGRPRIVRPRQNRDIAVGRIGQVSGFEHLVSGCLPRRGMFTVGRSDDGDPARIAQTRQPLDQCLAAGTAGNTRCIPDAVGGSGSCVAIWPLWGSRFSCPARPPEPATDTD